jgi:hypothetical protein
MQAWRAVVRCCGASAEGRQVRKEFPFKAVSLAKQQVIPRPPESNID